MFRQANGIRLWLGAACLLGLAFVSTPGCGKPKGTVTGKVTLNDGTPVSPGSVVIFWGSDNHQYPGLVGADGAYSVPDLPVGEMKVTVAPPSELAQTFAKARPPGDRGESKAPAVVPIPLNYQDPAKTPLKYTVQDGPNDYPITIK
ncbi:MAG TPA: carboxypeptidase-like regulatory domain-containing protein [Gemmataceae bacterium]|nr:carboxypeptidase-like regulatory domain-containing protein [Gemmataceae bacterium]